jgi:hypothetical protein
MDERPDPRERADDRDYRDRNYRADRDYRDDREYRDRNYRERDYYRDRDYRDIDYRADARVSVGVKFAAGIIAGIIAAILMLGLMMAYSNAIGEGITMPLKALGALIYGVEALVAGTTAMAAGAGIVFAVSIVLGILFGLAMSRRSSVILTMLAGIVIGIAIWVAMDLYVLPQMDPTMAARIALMPTAYFIAHVLFGIGLGLTSVFVRAFGGKRRRHSVERPA